MRASTVIQLTIHLNIIVLVLNYTTKQQMRQVNCQMRVITHRACINLGYFRRKSIHESSFTSEIAMKQRKK
jgi:hypothetical protein